MREGQPSLFFCADCMTSEVLFAIRYGTISSVSFVLDAENWILGEGFALNILSQYYRGINQQLRSEVDFINSIFLHQGEKGSGNESAMRELVRKFIPKRYGVGTG